MPFHYGLMDAVVLYIPILQGKRKGKKTHIDTLFYERTNTIHARAAGLSQISHDLIIYVC